MTAWQASPIVNGRERLGTTGMMHGEHKTAEGRERFIRTHGQPGVTYAVALRWPTGGWVPADPVTVPGKPDA
jgi:hypothetical protein